MADHLAPTEGAPPLSIWCWVGLLVLVLFLLIWAQLPKDWQTNNSVVYSRQQRAALCEARWNQRAPWTNPDQKGVLAIGSSLFHAATGARAEFLAHLDPNVAWENCWINSGQWPNFVQLQPAASRLKPALVLVQSDVLLVAPWRQTVFSAFNSALKDQLRGKKETMESDVYERTFTCDGRSKQQPAHYYAQLSRADPQVFAQARQWLTALKASGAKVVIVDIPRSAALEAQMSDFLPEWRRSLQQLANDSGAHYWQVQVPPLAGAFCPDGAHLAQGGRQQTAIQISAFVHKTLAESVR